MKSQRSRFSKVRNFGKSILLQALLVRYGQFLSALLSAALKNFLPVFRFHAFAESVFVYPLALGRLISPFHVVSLVVND